MKEFLLLFRSDRETTSQLSPEQLQAITKPWQDWMGSLAAQDRLVNIGNRLSNEGTVVKPNKVVTNGPYVELKEALGGYTLIKAASLVEATELAKSCPILDVNGSVEVRPIVSMHNN